MRIIPVLIIVAIFFLVDIYIYRSLGKTQTKRWIKLLFPISSLVHLTVYTLYFLMFAKGQLYAPYLMNLLVGITFLLFVGKLFTVIILVSERIGNVLLFFRNWISPKRETVLPSRRKFVRNVSLGAAALPFVSGIFGLIIGKYLYKVNEVKLKSKKLPKAFAGLRVVQISDFHAGSFDWFEQVKEGMQMINDLKPDLILFTGDLVNNRTNEVLPFQELWTNLESKYGKFAVLGNHDYGDYVPWDSEKEREENMNQMKRFYSETGFKLLMNEHQMIDIEGEKIALVGVENWGTGRFPKYGDLPKALKGIDENSFKILLSHDPDHWKFEVKSFPTPIDLTLSGHTHGAQFGVPIPFKGKWSPASWRYDYWRGLYQEKDRNLYVNTGFGFLGYPGRINMAPEITLFVLNEA
jgi:predicted MPP superfamily phosphohydrolase